MPSEFAQSLEQEGILELYRSVDFQSFEEYRTRRKGSGSKTYRRSYTFSNGEGTGELFDETGSNVDNGEYSNNSGAQNILGNGKQDFALRAPAEETKNASPFEKEDIKTLLKERFENYGKDEENLEIAAEALSNLEPSDDSLWRDPSRVHNIAKGINEQFINKGYVDFRGRKVESPEDVALMMQVCRDPRYETFRLLLVSNGKIVNVTSITSQLPGLTVGIEKDSWSETIKSVSARMKALKADGYYLVHNHPSGEVSPSNDDLATTKAYITNIPGFLGHIILDHDKFHRGAKMAYSIT